ncbi:MAG: hypothetical protein V9G23_20145 [Giesbergeria sp.]
MDFISRAGRRFFRCSSASCRSKRFLRREVWYCQRLGLFQPTVAIGLASVVPLDLEMLAEHFQLSLDGAQIPVDTRILELADAVHWR